MAGKELDVYRKCHTENAYDVESKHQLNGVKRNTKTPFRTKAHEMSTSNSLVEMSQQ